MSPASSDSGPAAPILIVDDEPANLRVLERVLASLGEPIVKATSGEGALARLRETDFAVVLLDLMMPGVGGLRTAELARAQHPGGQVPIILMTAGNTPPLAGYAHGAVDVLQKPLDQDIVRAKVAVFVELFRAREQLRRQASQLAEQERVAAARTAALLNASVDAIIGMDHAGRITELSGAAEVMFGRRREEVLGQSLADLLIPAHLREAHRRGLAHYLATGESRVLDTRIEVTALRADGTELPIELAISRVAVEGPPTFIGYARDLTAHRAAERERSVLLGRERLILAAAGDGIYGLDAEGRTTFVNPAAARMLGRAAEELLGHVQHELVHHTRPDGSPYAREDCPIDSAAREGTVHHRDDEVFWRKDGTSFPVEYTSTPIQEADGVAGAVVVFRDITERKRVEKARAFLAQASEAFASSLDYEATLQTVVGLAVPHVADWCAVEIVGQAPGATVTLAVAHVDPVKVALAEALRRRYPPDPDAPQGVLHVLRTGRSELYEEVSDAMLERGAQDAEHLRILRELGLRSAMIVPIALPGHVLGAITFIAAESGRRYSQADLTVAEELGRRAAMAVANAREHRATQMAEERQRFLAEATEALGSSLDYATTLERVVRLAVPRIADAAAVYIVEGDGAIRLSALVTSDPAHEALARELDALHPLRVEQEHRLLPRVISTGRAEVVSEPLELSGAPSASPRATELARELGIRSYMAVPLAVRGEVLGAVALTTSTSGRRFGPDDLPLAEELARRAGLAVDNAQLYGAAQAAIRLKDEFLATVSHELRTPLTAILAWTHLLRAGHSAQLARALETIERNANAQARIIDDVLDVSRIVTGQLRLGLELVNVADVVNAAVDTLRPAAEAKELELFVTLDPAVGEISADPARLQQIVWNLLGNAIKFTPRGGRVELRLERRASNVCLRVSDTGQGIRADFLPHVFERFRQADSTPTRAYGGLGLGLAIVRHLVELHGGNVAAESEGEGRGATFTVLLPVPAVAPGSESHPAAIKNRG